MAEPMSYNQWFYEWFSSSLVDSLGGISSELKTLPIESQEIENLTQALDEVLHEIIAAADPNIAAADRQEMQMPIGLADLLAMLSHKLEVMAKSLATSQREIEVLRRELN